MRQRPAAPANRLDGLKKLRGEPCQSRIPAHELLQCHPRFAVEGLRTAAKTSSRFARGGWVLQRGRCQAGGPKGLLLTRPRASMPTQRLAAPDSFTRRQLWLLVSALCLLGLLFWEAPMPKRRTTPHPQSSRLRLPRRPSPQRRWRRHRQRLPCRRCRPAWHRLRRGALLRRSHRRLARPGRLAEAAPRRYRRHGGHRRVLDCVVRPARSQGFQVLLVDPARSNGPRAAPRATPRTPSGFAACTVWACSAALTRRGHPRVAVTCARAGHGVAGPSSPCKRRWSK